MQHLDENEYLEKLKEVLERREKIVTEKVAYQRNYKLTFYALSRGFEQDLIFFILKDKGL